MKHYHSASTTVDTVTTLLTYLLYKCTHCLVSFLTLYIKQTLEVTKTQMPKMLHSNTYCEQVQVFKLQTWRVQHLNVFEPVSLTCYIPPNSL